MINQKMTIQAHICTIKYNMTTNTSIECNKITFDDAQQLYYLGECEAHHMPKEKGMILTQQEMRHLRDALLQVIPWQANQSQRNTLQHNKIIHVETLRRDDRTHTTIEVNLVPDENSQILCSIGECSENQSIGQNGVLLDAVQTLAFCDALYDHLDAKPEEIQNLQEDDTTINETSETEESQETASTVEEASEAVQEPQEDDTTINETSETEESQETAFTVGETSEAVQEPQEDDTTINETSETEESQETVFTVEEASEAVQEPQEDDTTINETSETEESQETVFTVEETSEETQKTTGNSTIQNMSKEELKQLSQKLVNLVVQYYGENFVSEFDPHVPGTMYAMKGAYKRKYKEPFPEIDDDQIDQIFKLSEKDLQHANEDVHDSDASLIDEVQEDLQESQEDVATANEAQGHEEEIAESEEELEQFSQKLVNLIAQEMKGSIQAKPSPFVLGQLKGAFTKEYGEPFPEMSDDEVYRIIKVNAVRYKNKLYVITDTLQSCLSQIIQNGKQMGCQIFYYTRIMDLHTCELNALHIYDKDLVKALIDCLFSNYPNNKNYFKLNQKCNIFNDVFKCFTKETPYLTAEQVQEKRPYLEMSAIKSCLGSQWPFVYLVTDHLYTTYTRIYIDPEEAETVKAQVLQDVEEKGFTSLDKYDMPVSESLNRSDIPSFPIREAFYLQYLRDDLCRNNHLVSKQPMTTQDIILGYIQSHDVIKHSEIQEYMNENVYENSWTSAWDFANIYMVRINEDTVVNKELISVDVEKADAAIANYVGDGCRPITEIHSFALFPYVENYPWNQYFLAGYCKHFSKKYGLSNILDLSYCGLVYAKNGPYNGKDFNTLAAELLAKTDLELTAPNVRTYMKEHGYAENLPNKKRAQQITEKAQFLRANNPNLNNPNPNN